MKYIWTHNISQCLSILLFYSPTQNGLVRVDQKCWYLMSWFDLINWVFSDIIVIGWLLKQVEIVTETAVFVTEDELFWQLSILLDFSSNRLVHLELHWGNDCLLCKGLSITTAQWLSSAVGTRHVIAIVIDKHLQVLHCKCLHTVQHFRVLVCVLHAL